jgi:hypothetical protein
MRYQKQSLLERLVKGLMLSIPLYIGIGCTSYQVNCEGEMIRRKNAIVAPADFDLDGKITKANKALIEFPNAEQINKEIGVDAVRSVDKYLIPGAKFLLIHGRQAHLRSGISKETREEVMKVQTEIYLSSDYLRRNKRVKLRRAHDEGITSEIWADVFIGFLRAVNNTYRDYADELQRDIRKIEHKLIVNPEESLTELLEEKRRKLKVMQQSEEETVLYGALLKLGAEKKLKILPSEKRRKPYKHLKLKDKIHTVLDLREDAFLEIAAGQKHCLVYVIFGGTHAWGGKTSCGKEYDLSGRLSEKDNLAVWNAANSDKKFSLIELTFKSYNEREDAVKAIKKSIENQD